MFRYAHVCRHMHAQSQSKRIIDKTHTHTYPTTKEAAAVLVHYLPNFRD